MRRDVQEIFRATPTQKQVMMFSATLSQEVRPICKKFMQNPLEIYVDDEKTLTLHGLNQFFIKLDEKEKNRKLNELLDDLQFNQAIIFVKSTVRATELDKLLKECNFPSVAVHSGVSQEERYVFHAHLLPLSTKLEQNQALQGFQGLPRAYLRCHGCFWTWYRYRTYQLGNQLRSSCRCGFLPPSCWSCRSIRYQGPFNLVRE